MNKKIKPQSKSRKEHQKKPIIKGLKSTRGQPEHYDSLKKCVSVGITKNAVDGLDQLSHERGISRSELIERIGRGLIKILDITPYS